MLVIKIDGDDGFVKKRWKILEGSKEGESVRKFVEIGLKD